MAKKKTRKDRDDELESSYAGGEELMTPDDLDTDDRAAMSAASAVPLALVGAGLGWFLVQQLTRGEDAPPRRATRRVTTAARRRGSQAKSGVEEVMERSPFAVGAAVFALGLLGGVVLPASQWENEVLGDKSDELKNGVRGRAKEIRERASGLARDAADSFRGDAQRMGARLLTGSALELARTALEGAAAKNRSATDRSMDRSRTR